MAVARRVYNLDADRLGDFDGDFLLRNRVGNRSQANVRADFLGSSCVCDRISDQVLRGETTFQLDME